MLGRLHLPFICSSPDIDESHRANESAVELVKRLAEQKARALAPAHPGHLIIGSDQVAALDGRIIGKPHTFENAREQLLAASGKRVSFLTGLALLNSETGRCQVDCVPFTVQMRVLDAERIERYLRELDERRISILASIEEQGKLTPQLEILKAARRPIKQGLARLVERPDWRRCLGQ